MYLAVSSIYSNAQTYFNGISHFVFVLVSVLLNVVKMTHNHEYEYSTNVACIKFENLPI